MNNLIRYIGKLITLLFEKHVRDCICSYCKGEYRLHSGLNIPKKWKEWNSWYVIKLPFGYYLRWTNRWFRCVERSK